MAGPLIGMLGKLGGTMFGQQVFTPPFAEFQLQHIELSAVADAADMGGGDVPVAANGPVIVLPLV